MIDDITLKNTTKMVLNPYFCYFRLQKATFCTKTINKKKLYSNTILLPKTKFPLRLGKKEIIERDVNINNSSAFQSLYSWQREHLKGEEFVLHDGPPYANGAPHMGHAINKILKDAILRHHILQGQKVHYVPGWDCHGLPIELKVLTKINEHIEPQKIRKRARNFAMEAVEKQKAAFKSWGVIGDWENAYLTCNAAYVKNQMEQFYKLFERGLVFRDYKPVYWSPSSRTALAEAELEYNPNHKSTAITLRILLNKVPELLNKYKEKGIYALIWTTTPWSLISNQAVCYNPNLNYSVVQKPHEENVYIIAAELLDSLSQKFNCNLKVLETFSGKQLETSTYFHPICKEKVLSLLPAAHATLKGTGLVHTAPAHGPEDFLVALENKLPVICMVDEGGCYTLEAGENLHGKFVLNDGNAKILEIVAKDVVHEEIFVHSYPYDWRTKKPVILRASRQWFVNTNAIKTKAEESLRDVQICPKISAENHKTSLISQLQKRPYWCISRQRKWGVPIPVFYKNETGEALVNKETIVHLTGLLDKYGTDFWWSLPLGELLPSSLELKEGDVEKGEDILDIWFDSGISWSSVLPEKSADLYLEGSDQFTGWFQSSLMTSVALQNKAPYKAIYVHGFAVDEKGLKMSKSVGNVVNPSDVVQGKNGQNTWGVDTLRWWVTCHANQDALIPVSKTILQASFDEVQKIRNVLRFALGAINDYQFKEVAYENLTLLDRCLLHLLFDFQQQAATYSKDYQFNKIATLVLNFATNSLSSLYFTAIKDRLYCDDQNSKKRISAQYTLFAILNVVTRAVAPMVPHLAEEIHSYLPQKATDSFFKDGQVFVKQEWRNESLNKFLDVILDVKSEINKEFGSETLGIGVNVRLPLIVFRNLSDVTATELDLSDIFQVAHVQLEENSGFPEEYSWTSCKSCLHSCNRCRRVASDVPDELCERCKTVVENVAKSAAVNQ